MRENMTRLITIVCLLAGLGASSVFAEDLGIAAIVAANAGNTNAVKAAVKAKVKDAVEAIYASGDDDDSIKTQIAAIMNEAALTGNEDVVTSAVDGAFEADGGNDALTTTAVEASSAYTDFAAAVTAQVAQSVAANNVNPAVDDNPLGDGDDADIEDEDSDTTPR
jgi:hypothetical protein